MFKVYFIAEKKNNKLRINYIVTNTHIMLS